MQYVRVHSSSSSSSNGHKSSLILQQLSTLQVQKQSRLNDLHLVIGLRRDQIPMHLNGSPDGGGGAAEGPAAEAEDPLLVFATAEWKRLQTRTEELKAERARHKGKFK